MNYLAKAANYLQDRMEASASERVRYVRAGHLSKQVQAIIGRIDSELEDTAGFALKTNTWDFTIRRDFFYTQFPDEPAPKRNDEIWHRVGTSWNVYTVNSDGFVDGHYVASDGYGVAFRIHTRLDRVERVD